MMPSAAGKVIFITSIPSDVGAKTTVARFSLLTSGPGTGLPGVGVPYEAAKAVGLCRVLRQNPYYYVQGGIVGARAGLLF